MASPKDFFLLLFCSCYYSSIFQASFNFLFPSEENQIKSTCSKSEQIDWKISVAAVVRSNTMLLKQ